MNLKRHIGTPGLLFAAMGGVLGSGWLFGPFFAAQVAGPAAIISWVLGGLLMMVVAFTFAELSSTFPVAGGSVRFLQLSHGSLVGFTMAWIAWLPSAAVAPIETMALIHYATNYIPGLMHDVNNVHILSGEGMAVAAILMFVMCVINSYGVKLLSKTNNAVMVFKLTVPILTILVLLSIDFHPSNLTSAGFAPMGIKGILAAMPTAGIIFSFIGFSPAIQLAGEAKSPQRSIPIAIIGALCLGILLYVILQFAFICALNPKDLALGWTNLSFYGDAGPFAGMAVGVGAVWLAYIIYVGAFISPFGTALIYTASTARMGLATGENGYLPAFMKKLNRHGVPIRILMLNYCIGILLFLPFPTWQKMVSFLVSALVFAYGVGPLSLQVLRKVMPDEERPFKVWMPRVTCLVAFYVCNLIVFWTGWDIVSKILIAIVIGYISLIFIRQTEQGKQLHFDWHKSYWMFLYLIALGVVSYLGGFGHGLGVIPFGWDFVVIAGVSLVIYELAVHAGLRGLEST